MTPRIFGGCIVMIYLLRLPTTLQSRIERRSIDRGTYHPCQTRSLLCPVYPNSHWTRNSRTFQRGLQRGLQRIVRGSYSNMRDAIASRYQASSIGKGCKHSGMGAMPGERFTRSLRYCMLPLSPPYHMFLHQHSAVLRCQQVQRLLRHIIMT